MNQGMESQEEKLAFKKANSLPSAGLLIPPNPSIREKLSTLNQNRLSIAHAVTQFRAVNFTLFPKPH